MSKRPSPSSSYKIAIKVTCFTTGWWSLEIKILESFNRSSMPTFCCSILGFYFQQSRFLFYWAILSILHFSLAFFYFCFIELIIFICISKFLVFFLAYLTNDHDLIKHLKNYYIFTLKSIKVPFRFFLMTRKFDN